MSDLDDLKASPMDDLSDHQLQVRAFRDEQSARAERNLRAEARLMAVLTRSQVENATSLGESIPAVQDIQVDHQGPDMLLTHRDQSAERAGTPTFQRSGRSLESAIDDAVAAASAGKRDVVVWQGNRVVAVVGPDPEGRVMVTPFLEIPGNDG